MKKVLLIVLLLCVVIIMPTYGMDKADALNKLEVLKGDGEDYLLDQDLTRAQGFVFIVRLMGKEALVQDKTSYYSQYTFEDTDSDKWYSTYLGFGKIHGLLNGYPDGTYKPNDKLSEREFYAMVLNAINVSYNWGEVEEVAKENELINVSDEENSKTYKRKRVVEVLYNVLENDPARVEALAKSLDISEFDLNSTGLYGADDLKTEIQSINSKDKETTVIYFNEAVHTLEIEIDDLDISDIEVDDKKVTIEHEASEEKEYDLTITQLVDAKGFEQPTITETFEGYQKKAVESNYFYISSIDAVNKKQIDVYFTHPVDLAAEIPMEYEIYEEGDLLVEGDYDTLSTHLISGVDNGVSLWLEDESLDKNKKYKLKVSSEFQSKYGATLEDKTEYFYGTDTIVEELKVVDVEYVGEDLVRIIFNRDVSKASLKGDNIVAIEKGSEFEDEVLDAYYTGEGDKEYRQVDVRFSDIEEDEQYTLKIEGVKDIFGAAEIDDKSLKFVARDKDNDLEIKTVYAKNMNLIYIYFNQPIASDIDESDFLSPDDIEEVIYDSDTPRVVKLIMEDGAGLSGNNEYEVSIFDESISKLNEEKNSSSLSYEFEGSDDEMPDIRFENVHFVSDDYVYVEFNIPVSMDTDENNFRLQYHEDDHKKYIDAESVSLINPMTAVVKFDNLDSDEDYKLIGDDLEDYSEQFTTDDEENSVDR